MPIRGNYKSEAVKSFLLKRLTSQYEVCYNAIITIEKSINYDTKQKGANDE